MISSKAANPELRYRAAGLKSQAVGVRKKRKTAASNREGSVRIMAAEMVHSSHVSESNRCIPQIPTQHSFMEPTKSDLTRAGYVQKSGDKVTGDYRPPRQTPPRQIPAPVDVHSTSSRRHSVKHTLQATTADIEIEGTAPSGTPRAGTDAGHWFWDHESATGASIIHLTTTDANSSNWPAEYIYGVSDVDPGELQPFIRIDVEEAYDPDVIAIHERERRKKMLEDWLIDAGSYIGNRETGAVKGSSSACIIYKFRKVKHTTRQFSSSCRMEEIPACSSSPRLRAIYTTTSGRG